MSTPEPRRHHYVPRLLLKGFAVERKPGKFQTKVFDKQTDRTFAAAIEDVMVEGDFNALDLDDAGRVSVEALLGDLESLAAPIVAKILAAGSLEALTTQERLEIARFVAVQFIRGTGHRAMFTDAARQLGAEMATRGVDLGDLLVFDEREGKAFGLVSILDMVPEFAAHLALKDLLLLKAPTGAEFILGDNPVSVTNKPTSDFWGNLGIASEGVQVHLPLSAEYCLALWCPSHREKIEKQLSAARRRFNTLRAQSLLGAVPSRIPAELLVQGEAALRAVEPLQRALFDGEALPCSRENVTHFNALQVMHSERFVASRSGAFDLPREMIATDARYRQGRRMRVG